jgi:hypothetical protein
MRCITLDEGCIILQDIHAGICGSHAGARSLVGKTYKQDFFWPTAVSDADSLVRLISCRPYLLPGLSQHEGLDLEES